MLGEYELGLKTEGLVREVQCRLRDVYFCAEWYDEYVSRQEIMAYLI